MGKDHGPAFPSYKPPVTQPVMSPALGAEQAAFDSVNAKSIFDMAGPLISYSKPGQPESVCSLNNAVDSYLLEKTKLPGTDFTEVYGRTVSGPDGLVASETCYVVKVGFGWAGVCYGHSDDSYYLGSQNGYPKAGEYRMKFFADDSFMTAKHCEEIKK